MQSLSEKIRAEEPKPTFADLHTPLKQPERSQRECYDMGFRVAREKAALLAEQWEREQATVILKDKITALQGELAEARRERDRFKGALERIARPALGGKEQQWTAQEALKAKPE